jgi:hypothetical protein
VLRDANGLAIELLQASHLHSVECRPTSEERYKTMLPKLSLLRELCRVHRGEILRELLHEARLSPRRLRRNALRSVRNGAGGGTAHAQSNSPKEVVVPIWAWILIIVLLVLLLTGGVYVRR